jgi:hypothetical protein
MASDSLNQAALNALQQVGGEAGTGAQALIEGLLPRAGASFSEALADASRQIDALRAANAALAEVVQNNTRAINANSAAQGGQGGAGAAIGSVASTIFGSGLGLSQLIGSIARLFGGGAAPTPTVLIPYNAPPPVSLDLADSPGPYSGIGGLSPVTYGADGLPRASGAPAGQPLAPQISIQVNALDSRSFLDHSVEIAAAVRQAMLNMHSLNDVVSEL